MSVFIGGFRKDQVRQPGQGYGQNMGTTQNPRWVAERAGTVAAVIIHTTNNLNKGTRFENEATFLRDSPDVSCHDLIGRQGQIAEILPPGMVAWHAGKVKVGFSNFHSVGIEMHVSVGEQPPAAMLDTLTWRVKSLIAQHQIPKAMIETHRAVALLKGRKSDPEGLTDAQFYAWRDGLFPSAEPDWPVLWGTLAPYRADWGLPQAWRAAHLAGTPWGQAITDEHHWMGEEIQQFERCLVLWSEGAATPYWGEHS